MDGRTYFAAANFPPGSSAEDGWRGRDAHAGGLSSMGRLLGPAGEKKDERFSCCLCKNRSAYHPTFNADVSCCVVSEVLVGSIPLRVNNK